MGLRCDLDAGAGYLSDLFQSPTARSQPEPAQSTMAEPLSTVIIVALAVATLYVGRDIFVPIAIAILVSFVLSPPILLLRRAGFGRVVSGFDARYLHPFATRGSSRPLHQARGVGWPAPHDFGNEWRCRTFKPLFLAQTLLNLSFGFTVAGGLSVIGVLSPILWVRLVFLSPWRLRSIRAGASQPKWFVSWYLGGMSIGLLFSISFSEMLRLSLRPSPFIDACWSEMPPKSLTKPNNSWKRIVKYCDDVALQALLMAQADLRRGVLDEVRQIRIKETVEEVLEDLSDHVDPSQASVTPKETDVAALNNYGWRR
jgi:hypothetical protein